MWKTCGYWLLAPTRPSSTSRTPEEPSCEAPAAEASRPGPPAQVQEAGVVAARPTAGQGTDHRGPAPGGQAAYAEGRLRLHRWPGGRRGLPGSPSPGLPRRGAPPVDP